MDISQAVDLAAANEASKKEPKIIENHEEQYKILMDKAEIHTKKKKFYEAEKDLIHALMERVYLDGVDSLEMLSIFKMLLDVFTSNKHKHLVEVTGKMCLEMEELLKAEKVSSHLFIEVLYEFAKGYFAKDNTEFGFEIMTFVVEKVKELEGVQAYRLGSLYTTVGEAYRRKNLYKEAISFHDQAVAIRREADDKSTEVNPDIKRDLADSLTCLGASHRSSMSYPESEKCYTEALHIRRDHLHSDGPSIGKSYNDIAELFRDMKQHEKAIRYHIAAVDTFTQFFDADHPRVINAKGNYGVTLNHHSRYSYEQGNALVKEAIAFFITHKYPSDHVWVKKFRAEMSHENAQVELDEYKKRVKKYQSQLVLQEINDNLQNQKYSQLEEKMKNNETEHKAEMNKIKFMNSVLSEQISMNKTTTENLLSENSDMLKKIETLISEQKRIKSEHSDEMNKFQTIFGELVEKTEKLEVQNAKFQKEEGNLLEEIDSLNARDDERLSEIERLEAKVWELEKNLKVENFKSTKLAEELDAALNAPVILVETKNYSSQIPDGEEDNLERISTELCEEYVSCAVNEVDAIVEKKKLKIAAREALISFDSEAFVRHQYPVYEEDIPDEKDVKNAANESMILDLSVALKMEEIMSTTAFSLLEDMKSATVVQLEDQEQKHNSAMEDSEYKIISMEEKLCEIEHTSKVNLEELELLRTYMKEHDLDPKKNKLQGMKAKLNRLENEVTEKDYKIDELETELFTLKIDHDHVVDENKQNGRTMVEMADTNHLLMLKLKAANYEIEHMSAELHLDRHKLGELQNEFSAKDQVCNEQSKQIQILDEKQNFQKDMIAQRDETIENIENEILDLKGIPRNNNKADNKEVTSGDDNITKPDSKTCFLTNLDVEVEVDEMKPPEPSPSRPSFLPALETGQKSPKPDDKSTVEGSPTLSRNVSFLEPIERSDSGFADEEVSSDFAEVLFLGPPKTPTTPAAIKKAKHTKDKDRHLRRQKHFCTMCDNKIKGQPKVIPTSLQNVLQPGENYNDISKSKSGSSKEFQMAGFPNSSKNYLDSQVIWRETYSTRGEDCIFCCWDCAREWNRKYTPVNYRYTTQKLIDIAAGKFIS